MSFICLCHVVHKSKRPSIFYINYLYLYLHHCSYIIMCREQALADKVEEEELRRLELLAERLESELAALKAKQQQFAIAKAKREAWEREKLAKEREEHERKKAEAAAAAKARQLELKKEKSARKEAMKVRMISLHLICRNVVIIPH